MPNYALIFIFCIYYLQKRKCAILNLNVFSNFRIQPFSFHPTNLSTANYHSAGSGLDCPNMAQIFLCQFDFLRSVESWRQSNFGIATSWVGSEYGELSLLVGSECGDFLLCTTASGLARRDFFPRLEKFNISKSRKCHLQFAGRTDFIVSGAFRVLKPRS